VIPEDTPNDAEREQEDRETEDVDDEYEPDPYSNGIEQDT
jgi:hypothetical protein